MSISEDLETLFRQWLQAAALRDSDWYKAHLADDFLYIGMGGGTLDRDGLIAANERGKEGNYSLLSFASRPWSPLTQAYGTYSARCTIPAEAGVSLYMRERYGQGCTVAFTNLWRPEASGLRCISHATAILP